MMVDTSDTHFTSCETRTMHAQREVTTAPPAATRIDRQQSQRQVRNKQDSNTKRKMQTNKNQEEYSVEMMREVIFGLSQQWTPKFRVTRQGRKQKTDTRYVRCNTAANKTNPTKAAKKNHNRVVMLSTTTVIHTQYTPGRHLASRAASLGKSPSQPPSSRAKRPDTAKTPKMSQETSDERTELKKKNIKKREHGVITRRGKTKTLNQTAQRTGGDMRRTEFTICCTCFYTSCWP